MLKVILRDKKVLTGLIIVLFFVIIAIFAPIIAPNDPLNVNIAEKLHEPCSKYWLGTDNLGRCIASRIIFGARKSLFYSGLVLVISFAIGIPVGITAGYIGGKTDLVIMRIIDIVLAIPGFVVALAVAGTLGANLRNLVISMAFVWWAGYARIIRGMVLSIKHEEFISTAKMSGCSHIKIILRHVLRNTVPMLLVLLSLELGAMILAISGFSFIGLGAQPPTPEWGVMISDSKDYIQTQPMLMFYPGVAIVLTVTGFNLLGEGLKNAFIKK